MNRKADMRLFLLEEYFIHPAYFAYQNRYLRNRKSCDILKSEGLDER